MEVIRAREICTDPKILETAKDLRNLQLRDYSKELGVAVAPAISGPREEMEVNLMPTELYRSHPIAQTEPILWEIGTRILNGESLDLAKELGTLTDWLLLGSFPNSENQGFEEVFPPEISLDLSSEFETLDAKSGWRSYAIEGGGAMVDLSQVFQPSEEVCAYALCFVSVSEPTKVQIRGAGNDRWKLWVGGKPVFEYAEPGRAIFDREIIPVDLPPGRTPILVKVCNDKKDWAFVLRITDEQGRPLEGLEVDLKP
jgi:hypothetical protein